MTLETLERLRLELADSPILRADFLPTIDEIDRVSQDLSLTFVADYREFLLSFGGAMVGPYPIFGLRPVEVMGNDHWSAADITMRFRNNGLPGTEDWLIFSEDHAGNPIGMNSTGQVWIFDHDFGGSTLLAPTFEAYLRIRCLGMATSIE